MPRGLGFKDAEGGSRKQGFVLGRGSFGNVSPSVASGLIFCV